MKLVAGLSALAALALVACGPHYDYGSGGANPTPITPPTGVLAGWASFPADQKPRPIVWLQNGSPASGYGSDSAKMGAYCNKYALAAALPATVPATVVVTWSDGTSSTYRGISAALAFAGVRADRSHVQEPQCSSIPPLVINAARLGMFDFVTDRGKAQMTDWLFSAIGINGELAYPAILPGAFWTGGILLQAASGSTVLSVDGR